MISLNELLKTIKGIAEAHKMVHTFAAGQKYDISANEATVYPLIWAVPIGASPGIAGKSNRILSNTIDYRITLVSADIEKADNSNEIEILSDSILILTDILSRLQEVSQNQNEWELAGIGNFDPFVDSFDDMIAGHTCDIIISAFYGGDNCTDIIT